MKYPTKLSDAVHILCFIALAEDGQPLTSDAIAKSIATNASYVRQLMGLLRRGELLTSVRGHARPRSRDRHRRSICSTAIAPLRAKSRCFTRTRTPIPPAASA